MRHQSRVGIVHDPLDVYPSPVSEFAFERTEPRAPARGLPPAPSILHLARLGKAQVDYRGPVQFSAFEAYAAELGTAAAVTPETQSSDYESGIAHIDGEAWRIRTARNTPSKPGAFVAFWNRLPDGGTAPFRNDDVGAGLLVFVELEGRRGVFRFTGAHLAILRITSGHRPGKRGFRVYPSWCAGLNSQAAAAQRAQAPAFREY